MCVLHNAVIPLEQSCGPMDEQTDRLNSAAISRAMLLMWQKNKQVSMERT